MDSPSFASPLLNGDEVRLRTYFQLRAAFTRLTNGSLWPIAAVHLHIESDYQQSALPAQAAPQSGRLKTLD